MKKKSSNSAKVDKTAKTVKWLTKENINIGLSVLVFFVSAASLLFLICQSKGTRDYQKLSIKEISRKPKLYIEAREPAPVDSIYNRINNKAMIFRCNLINSGNEGAKDIKIRHSLYLADDPTISIYVSSQGKDKPIFYTPNDKTADSLSFNAEKIKLFIENDTAADSTISIYVPSADTTVYFKKTDASTVSIPLYYYDGISFQENPNKVERAELHYIWLLWNISPKTDTYYIPYTITSNRGIFQDTLKIKNPFYKEEN